MSRTHVSSGVNRRVAGRNGPKSGAAQNFSQIHAAWVFRCGADLSTMRRVVIGRLGGWRPCLWEVHCRKRLRLSGSCPFRVMSGQPWAQDSDIDRPSTRIHRVEPRAAVPTSGEHSHRAGVTSAGDDSHETACRVCTVDIPSAIWRKSSRSSYHGSCVEVAGLPGGVGVRDTQDHGKGPVLVFGAADWSAFIKSLKRASAF